MNYAGKLIIAPPKIKGSFWAKSVVFITEDSHSGSVGVVLNRPSKMSIRDFGEQCSVDLDYDGYVYVGGPTNVKALTLLHSSEWKCNNTLKINKKFSISSSEEILNRLSIGDTPYHWKLLVGLCTWAPDQLECEVQGKHPFTKDSSWLVATPNTHLVFSLDETDQWTTSIDQSSIEFVQTMLV